MHKYKNLRPEIKKLSDYIKQSYVAPKIGGCGRNGFCYDAVAWTLFAIIIMLIILYIVAIADAGHEYINQTGMCASPLST